MPILFPQIRQDGKPGAARGEVERYNNKLESFATKSVGLGVTDDRL